MSSAEVPFELGRFDAVGDWRTSANRGGGSLRESLFQIPVPHGNGPLPEGPQLIEAPKLGLVVAPQEVWSVAGVAGLEFTGESELVAVKEDLLGKVVGTSLSHDVRLAGFAIGAAGAWL
jgi:hypothetical protein